MTVEFKKYGHNTKIDVISWDVEQGIKNALIELIKEHKILYRYNIKDKKTRQIFLRDALKAAVTLKALTNKDMLWLKTTIEIIKL